MCFESGFQSVQRRGRPNREVQAIPEGHQYRTEDNRCPLPSLEDLFSSCCLSRAADILKDPSNPGHPLFDLLPSGRRFRSIKSPTNRKLMNSFYPRAIRELNTAEHWLFGTRVTVWTTVTFIEHGTDVYIATTPLYVHIPNCTTCI